MRSDEIRSVGLYNSDDPIEKHIHDCSYFLREIAAQLAERDGYVIYRTVTVGWTEPTAEKNYQEPIEKRKELAFIPAWDEEEVSEP